MTTCIHCGARTRAKPAPSSKFHAWATRAENIRDHGEPAPWQRGKKRKASLAHPVPVTVEFADGETRVASTYFVNAAGEPDVDAIVRAERESRIALACQPGNRWLAQRHEPEHTRRARTTELTDKHGHTRRYYLTDPKDTIACVTRAYVGNGSADRVQLQAAA